MKKLLSFACAIAVGAALSSMTYADVVNNNATFIDIPDNDPNGVSSDINFFGTNEIVDGDIEITLFDANHTWVGDLIVTIGNTQSGSIDLMYRTGGGNGDSSDLGDDYTFVSFQNLNPPDNGAFDPGGNWWGAANLAGSADVIPGGNAIHYGATGENNVASDLAAFFAGDSTDDTWTLFISDNAGDDTGFIAGGWGIAITSSPIPEPGTFTVLGVLGAVCVFRRQRTLNETTRN